MKHLTMRLRIWLSFRLVRLAQMINPGLMGAIVDILYVAPGIAEDVQHERDKWKAQA